MSSYVFDHVKEKMAKGELTFDAPDGAYKLALVTSAVFDDFANGALSDAEGWYADLSGYEITEDSNYNTAGYTGHQNLINLGFIETDVAGFTDIKVSATDIVFPISTIDADGAVVYKDDTNGTLIVAIDFGGRIISNNGTFQVNTSQKGFLKIT